MVVVVVVVVGRGMHTAIGCAGGGREGAPREGKGGLEWVRLKGSVGDVVPFFFFKSSLWVGVSG